MRFGGTVFLAATSLFFACGHLAMGQGVTVQDILDDFGPLLNPPPIRHPAATGTTPAPANTSQSSAGARAATGTTSSRPGAPSSASAATTSGTTGGSPIVYEGEMVDTSKIAFESFHEQVTAEMLKLVGLGFLDVTSRKVDVDISFGKMKMVFDGSTVSVDPVTLTINTKWKYSTATGGSTSGKSRIAWACRFEKAAYVPGDPFHCPMTLTVTSTSGPPQQVQGVWSATPLARDRYNVVIVLKPLPGGADPERAMYSAFAEDSKAWDAERRQVATESKGQINFPAYSKDAKPRWILSRIDGGGTTTSGVTPSGGSSPSGTNGGTRGQPNAASFFGNSDSSGGNGGDVSSSSDDTKNDPTKVDGPPDAGNFFLDNAGNPEGGTLPQGEDKEDLDIVGQGGSGRTPLPDDRRVEEDLDILGQEPD